MKHFKELIQTTKKRFILSVGFTTEQEIAMKSVAIKEENLSVSTYIRRCVVDDLRRRGKLK